MLNFKSTTNVKGFICVLFVSVCLSTVYSARIMNKGVDKNDLGSAYCVTQLQLLAHMI